MIVINGKDALLGRVASYSAKKALQGEEIAIVNCDELIISGNKQNIRAWFIQKRSRVGSGQKGPKVSRNPEKFVKRVVRGMLPNHRTGRGREALDRIKCYIGIPEQFKDAKRMEMFNEEQTKFIKIKELLE